MAPSLTSVTLHVTHVEICLALALAFVFVLTFAFATSVAVAFPRVPRVSACCGYKSTSSWSSFVVFVRLVEVHQPLLHVSPIRWRSAPQLVA